MSSPSVLGRLAYIYFVKEACRADLTKQEQHLVPKARWLPTLLCGRHELTHLPQKCCCQMQTLGLSLCATPPLLLNSAIVVSHHIIVELGRSSSCLLLSQVFECGFPSCIVVK